MIDILSLWQREGATHGVAQSQELRSGLLGCSQLLLPSGPAGACK